MHRHARRLSGWGTCVHACVAQTHMVRMVVWSWLWTITAFDTVDLWGVVVFNGKSIQFKKFMLPGRADIVHTVRGTL